MSYREFSNADIDDIISSAIVNDSKLTEWERDFVANVYELDYELSEKQVDMLWVIGEKLRV